jgi:hypothetical protein
MWSYLIQLVFMIFIPIMGRNGTATNPDIIMGKQLQFVTMNLYMQCC